MRITALLLVAVALTAVGATLQPGTLKYCGTGLGTLGDMTFTSTSAMDFRIHGAQPCTLKTTYSIDAQLNVPTTPLSSECLSACMQGEYENPLCTRPSGTWNYNCTYCANAPCVPAVTCPCSSCTSNVDIVSIRVLTAGAYDAGKHLLDQGASFDYRQTILEASLSTAFGAVTTTLHVDECPGYTPPPTAVPPTPAPPTPAPPTPVPPTPAPPTPVPPTPEPPTPEPTPLPSAVLPSARLCGTVNGKLAALELADFNTMNVWTDLINNEQCTLRQPQDFTYTEYTPHPITPAPTPTPTPEPAPPTLLPTALPTLVPTPEPTPAPPLYSLNVVYQGNALGFIGTIVLASPTNLAFAILGPGGCEQQYSYSETVGTFAIGDLLSSDCVSGLLIQTLTFSPSLVNSGAFVITGVSPFGNFNADLVEPRAPPTFAPPPTPTPPSPAPPTPFPPTPMPTLEPTTAPTPEPPTPSPPYPTPAPPPPIRVVNFASNVQCNGVAMTSLDYQEATERYFLGNAMLDYYQCPGATPDPPTPQPPTPPPATPEPPTPQPPTQEPPATPAPTPEPTTPSPLDAADPVGFISRANAIVSCNLLGGWEVTEVWDGFPIEGAIICSRSPYNGGNNCNGCDSWRLYVFNDGGRDMSHEGAVYPTKAGKYYSGHTPCAAGWNLQECGDWPTLTPEPPVPVPPTPAPQVNPYNSPACTTKCLERVCLAASGELELLVTGALAGDVFGTGFYSSDSEVGAAAVHAGKVQPGETAMLKIDCVGEKPSFTGSANNQVTTKDFAGASNAFQFSDKPINPPTIRICYNDPCMINECFAPGIVKYLQVTGSSSGSLWGDSVYTDDSSVAKAAVHAGLVSVGQTAQVVVSCAGPQLSFATANRNGIQSQSYGAWEGSFKLDIMQNLSPDVCYGRCLTGGCRTTEGQYSFLVQGTAAGPAWGSGPYTADSALGVVAAHAGAVAIGETKLVTFKCAGPQASFPGTTANQVTTSLWGDSWDGSISVCQTAECVNPAPLPCTGTCGVEFCAVTLSLRKVIVTGAIGGAVYGNGPFTDDSDVAAAAVFAGLVSVGETKVLELVCKGPQDAFTQANTNGVATLGYGFWPRSFELRA